MLVALADTHATEPPAMAEPLQNRVRAASMVVHAGDFTTAKVLDAFEMASETFVGVAGNRDTEAVRNRLPEWTVCEYHRLRILVTHGHRHSPTSLSMLARQEEADVAVVGHTHRPVLRREATATVVNPGSHTDPREGPASFATFEGNNGEIRVCLRTLDGDVIERVDL